MAEKLWNIKDAASYLNISVDRAYLYAREGMIPVCKIGSQLRFCPDTLAEFVRNGGNSCEVK